MLKAFQRFYKIACKAVWLKPQDVLETFSNSDLVTCKKQGISRMVFNVGHNKYRLITGYYFASTQTILYVKFAGTHKEYDTIDACKVNMFKQK